MNCFFLLIFLICNVVNGKPIVMEEEKNPEIMRPVSFDTYLNYLEKSTISYLKLDVALFKDLTKLCFFV